MLSTLLCISCNKIISPSYGEYNKCCQLQNLVYIDNQILINIQQLRSIGLDTQFCCSGHIYEFSRPYVLIKFDTENEMNLFISRVNDLIIKVKTNNIKPIIQSDDNIEEFGYRAGVHIPTGIFDHNMPNLSKFESKSAYMMEFSVFLYLLYKHIKKIKD